MNEPEESWREYLHAARRKVDMAGYHLEELRKHMSASQVTPDPPIPVQAHFEGVLYCSIAAQDQCVEAIKTANGLCNQTKRARVVDSLPAGIKDSFKRWIDAPILRDARDIRRRATHHHYDKSGWKVPPPTGVRAFEGPRELDGYCEQVTGHALELLRIIDDLEETLRGTGSSR